MYRFALIGQTSSGKTCYMATLALNVAHQGGMTAQLKRDLTADPSADVGKARGSSESAGASFVDDEIAEQNGAAWIAKAKQALERGELPAPNDPDRYLVDFRVGSDSRGMTEIRMVDYAGEFINQDRDPNEDRAALFRHLQDCDGLLIVAEVLPDGVDPAERRIVIDRIGKVADFFGSLHESCKGHLGTAIAVVLTKWDRYSDIDFTHPENENAKVRRYLQENPIHQSLVNRVKIFLVDQDEVAADLPIGIQYGNCAVFPASAFGRSVRNEQGQYKPDLESRQPFGLIEPLLWLASRFEELRTAKCEGEWKSTVAAHLRPFASRKIACEVGELLESVPRKSGIAERLRRLRASAWSAAAAAAVIWIGLVGGLLDLGRYAWRAASWRHNLAVSANPATIDADLKVAREFFGTCDETSWPGLLSFIPALRLDGKVEAAKIDQQRLAKAEQRFKDAKSSDDLDKIEPAAEYYVDEFPSGPLVQECRQKLEEIRIARARADLEKFIREHSAGIDSLESMAAVEAVDAEYRKVLSRAPAVAGQLERERREFEDRLTSRKVMLADAERHEQLRKGIDSALARADFLQAAAVIASHSVKDDFWDGSLRAFAAGLRERVETRLASLVRDENFDTATAVADDALKGLRDIEAAMPADRRDTRTVIVDTYPSLADVRRSALEEPYDRYLYGAVVESKTKANCDAYINRAPLGGMKFAVQEYRTYVDECERGAEIKVTPWIEWGKLPPDYTPHHEIRWELWADGKEVASCRELVRSDPTGEVEALERAVAMRAEGYERGIPISIKFWEIDDLTKRDRIGELEVRISPREMREGKTFKVQGGELEKPHTLWFKDLQGYRGEPELPRWRP
jgi:hypothetical protein